MIVPNARSTSVTTGLKWAPDTAPNIEDQPDQRAGGGGRVLEQLQADVVGRQAAGHDPRPDDGDDQQAGAERLGDEAPGEVGAEVAGAGLGLVGELGHAGARRRAHGDAVARARPRWRRTPPRCRLGPGRGSTSAASRSGVELLVGPVADRDHQRWPDGDVVESAGRGVASGRARRAPRPRRRPGAHVGGMGAGARPPGAPVSRRPQRGGELGAGRVARCTRTAPAARATRLPGTSPSRASRRRWT